MPPTPFILVVEDDPILKNLLGHTLAGKYQTMYASNGADALTAFEQYKPALVLLDLMLPGTDGFSVLAAIRARADALKNVPVIIVSNLGAPTDIEKAKSLGANDYLIKAEVAVEEIVGKIQSFVPVAAPAEPVQKVPVGFSPDPVPAPQPVAPQAAPAAAPAPQPPQQGGVPPMPPLAI